MPWAQYDLDLVCNGLCLCKTHHWAFDQQMLAILHEDEIYRIEVTPRAENAFQDEMETLLELRKLAGVIPRNRLPYQKIDWPHPDLLRQFYDMVPPR